MDLFVIYIGGRHRSSLIELHDMRFIVAESIEQTYEYLKQSWWGIPESLHIDAWGILQYADEYRIHLTQEIAKKSDNKLFFVNLGGYDKEQFSELHKNVFVVAVNEFEAKQKALVQISDWEVPHRDYLYEVDNLLNIDSLVKNQGYHIHLSKQLESKPFEFTCCYNPIGNIKVS